MLVFYVLKRLVKESAAIAHENFSTLVNPKNNAAKINTEI